MRMLPDLTALCRPVRFVQRAVFVKRRAEADRRGHEDLSALILQNGSIECFTLSGVKLPVTSVNESKGTATVNCRASLTSEKPRVRSSRSKSSELNLKSTV